MKSKTHGSDQVDNIPPSGRRAIGAARVTQLRAEAALQLAAADKQHQQALESRAKRMAGYVDLFKKVLPAVAGCFGLIVAFFYFYLAIQFFPSGLTVGDTVLFVFLALGFGLLSYLFMAGGMLALMPAVSYLSSASKTADPHERMLNASEWAILTAGLQIIACGVIYLANQAFPEVTEEATTIVLLIHLAAAICLGIAVAYWAYKDGAARHGIAGNGANGEFAFHGMVYGLFNLFLWPWFLQMLPEQGPHALLFSLLSGLCIWIAAWIWRIGWASRQHTSGNNDENNKATKGGSSQAASPRGPGWTPPRMVGVGACGLLAAGTLVIWLLQGPGWKAFGIKAAFAATLIALILWADLLRTKAERSATRYRSGATASEEGAVPTADRNPPKNGAANAKIPLEVVYRREVSAYAAVFFLVLSSSVALVADFAFRGALSTAVFRGLGLRVEKTTVRLKGEALSTVRAQARTAQIDLNVCTESDGSAMVSPVDVLWHGMGQRSLLRLGGVPRRDWDPQVRGADLEVAASELRVLRGQSVHCRDLATHLYFRSNSTVPPDVPGFAREMKAILTDVFPPATSAQALWAWRLDRVEVVGHADSMPLSDAGNQALSSRRAACVANQVYQQILKGSRPLDNVQLTWSGSGAREPKVTNCPLEGNRASLVQCHERNRSTSVRLIFACERLSENSEGGSWHWEASRACKPNEIARERHSEGKPPVLPRQESSTARSAENARDECSGKMGAPASSS